jgi:hypothetical protein
MSSLRIFSLFWENLIGEIADERSQQRTAPPFVPSHRCNSVRLGQIKTLGKAGKTPINPKTIKATGT